MRKRNSLLRLVKDFTPRHFILFGFISFSIAFAIGMLASPAVIADFIERTGKSEIFIKIFASFIAIVTVFATLARYLGSDSNDRDERTIRAMQASIFAMRDEVSKSAHTRAVLTDQEKIALLNNLNVQIRSNLSDKIFAEIEQKIADGAPEKALIKESEGQCDEAKRRLSYEVKALGRRSNLNLIIGIMMALGGLAVLGYAVFFSPELIDKHSVTSADSNSLKTTLLTVAIHYAPRLSLVIFIEIFAYFFLGLYKLNLGEIKYFQNEITNLELKFLALRVALGTNEKTMRMKVVSELCSTERNFVLKKGETTLDLEKAKIDKSSFSELGAAVAMALGKGEIAPVSKKAREQ